MTEAIGYATSGTLTAELCRTERKGKKPTYRYIITDEVTHALIAQRWSIRSEQKAREEMLFELALIETA